MLTHAIRRTNFVRRKSIIPQNRIPEFQELMWALLWMEDVVVMKIFELFLRVNENDKARAAAHDAADAVAGVVGFGSTSGVGGEKKSLLRQVSAIQSLRASATDPAEVSFNVGDVFEIIADLEPTGYPEWLDARGTRPVTRRGLIPRNHFVEHIPGLQTKATNAADELVLSEQTFLDELSEVAEKFFPQLRVILTAPEAKTLFGNWAELIPLSQDMVASMKARRDDLAGVLVEHLPLLKAPYTKYCGRISQAQDMYEKKILEPRFLQFEETFPALNKPTLNHLMRPVQRIMKYPLLIKELLRKEEEGSGSHIKLNKAFGIASEVALGVNSGMSSDCGDGSHVEKKDSINVVVVKDAETEAAEESVKRSAASENATHLVERPASVPLDKRPVFYSSGGSASAARCLKANLSAVRAAVRLGGLAALGEVSEVDGGNAGSASPAEVAEVAEEEEEIYGLDGDRADYAPAPPNPAQLAAPPPPAVAAMYDSATGSSPMYDSTAEHHRYEEADIISSPPPPRPPRNPTVDAAVAYSETEKAAAVALSEAVDAAYVNHSVPYNKPPPPLPPASPASSAEAPKLEEMAQEKEEEDLYGEARTFVGSTTAAAASAVHNTGTEPEEENLYGEMKTFAKGYSKRSSATTHVVDTGYEDYEIGSISPPPRPQTTAASKPLSARTAAAQTLPAPTPSPAASAAISTPAPAPNQNTPAEDEEDFKEDIYGEVKTFSSGGAVRSLAHIKDSGNAYEAMALGAITPPANHKAAAAAASATAAALETPAAAQMDEAKSKTTANRPKYFAVATSPASPIVVPKNAASSGSIRQPFSAAASRTSSAPNPRSAIVAVQNKAAAAASAPAAASAQQPRSRSMAASVKSRGAAGKPMQGVAATPASLAAKKAAETKKAAAAKRAADAAAALVAVKATMDATAAAARASFHAADLEHEGTEEELPVLPDDDDAADATGSSSAGMPATITAKVQTRGKVKATATAKVATATTTTKVKKVATATTNVKTKATNLGRKSALKAAAAVAAAPTPRKIAAASASTESLPSLPPDAAPDPFGPEPSLPTLPPDAEPPAGAAGTPAGGSANPFGAPPPSASTNPFGSPPSTPAAPVANPFENTAGLAEALAENNPFAT